MKITKLFALPAVVTLALIGAPAAPSGLSFTCVNGSNVSPCPTGQVHFTGTGYKNRTNIVVTGPNGVIDDGTYVASNGDLSFTETLDGAGTYIIEVGGKGKNGNPTETIVIDTYEIP